MVLAALLQSAASQRLIKRSSISSGFHIQYGATTSDSTGADAAVADDVGSPVAVVDTTTWALTTSKNTVNQFAEQFSSAFGTASVDPVTKAITLNATDVEILNTLETYQQMSNAQTDTSDETETIIKLVSKSSGYDVSKNFEKYYNEILGVRCASGKATVYDQATAAIAAYLAALHEVEVKIIGSSDNTCSTATTWTTSVPASTATSSLWQQLDQRAI